MDTSGHRPARVGIARLRAPPESPLLKEFVDAPDPVNPVERFLAAPAVTARHDPRTAALLGARPADVRH
ncbi:DUF3291 domain-containing protein [Streptomyces sp. SHP 1-2]|uniref:DUF3291 domain-containing protein n=1 Tax=Streptomyces sp. SHP 1-2 TaxID=2769489 RepID=UPI002236F905|nr:DUF3291 domain-containing protein [Streptomyces sp. SHP 1-2]MCW5250561.1 hypothetical protein [Streptomyces sp. SHP 1-2]